MWRKRDPIALFGSRLTAGGSPGRPRLWSAIGEARARDRGRRRLRARGPLSDKDQVTEMSTLAPETAGARTAHSQAVNEALREELRRDPTVFVIGEDVAEAGTPFKVLSGLVEEFGPSRVDSPISEAGITGLGLGAAITGMRPVVDIMFGDFLTLIMDQLVNQAAKIHYMSGGHLKAPLRSARRSARRAGGRPALAVAACVGRACSRAQGRHAGHSRRCQRPPQTAIRDDNPCRRHRGQDELRDQGPRAGRRGFRPAARRRRGQARGEDVTLVATSSMVYVALEAAELLEADGISAEVVDPRTLVPLDRAALVASDEDGPRDRDRRGPPQLRRLGRARSGDRRGRVLEPRCARASAAALDVPIPFSPVLEDETVPTPDLVAELARARGKVGGR